MRYNNSNFETGSRNDQAFCLFFPVLELAFSDYRRLAQEISSDTYEKICIEDKKQARQFRAVAFTKLSEFD